MKLKKPIVTYANGYLTHLRSLIIENNFKKLDKKEKWSCVPKYCIYLWRYKANKEIYYIGKGVYINGKLESCRAFLHRNDLLASTINTKEWYCEILFDGLTENQAYAAESYLISICEKERARRGQKIWSNTSLINKKREWKHERMIEKYLILNGNNDWKIIRREINGN